MPTSKEARVRSEGLLKRSTSDLPTSRDVDSPRFWRCFRSSARVSICPISSGVTSASVSKSRFTMLFLCKNGIQRGQQPIHFLLRNNERRQEAQHTIDGAIDQIASFHGFHHHMPAWPVQFRCHHQPTTTHVRDEGVFFLQTPEAFHKVRPNLLHMLEEVLVLNRLQDRQGGAARDRIATKRRTVRARAQCFSNVGLGHHRSDR